LGRNAQLIDDSDHHQSAPIGARLGGRPKYVIDIVGLSKTFQRQTRARSGYTTLKTTFLSLFSRRAQAEREVTKAIDALTLRIPRGSAVGIIGRNGSGKSTLLKLITGIYKPEQGTLRVNGRVAALIELGAGFHPDFTGRENLFLAGIMHGLTKREIESQFDAIVDFAELHTVIDDPVRTYSSGMFMRLGFSLAVHTNPDVLIIDEVLAVGDASFVTKCKERLAHLKQQGKTLLLVSHDLDAIERWCDEALWLEKGMVKDRGDPRRVIDHYRQFIEHGEETERLAHVPEASLPEQEPERTGRWGSREIEITGVRLLSKTGEPKRVLRPEEGAVIEVDFVAHQRVDRAVFGIGLHRTDGLVVHGSNTDIERVEFTLPKRGVMRYEIKRLGLLDGTYTLDVAVHAPDGYPYDYHQGCVEFAVRCAERQLGVYVPEHQWCFVTKDVR
jgi:lipopolysaccharide transport system ATP-binding protein